MNLFAALEVASGQVHAKTSERKKREDFQQFLDEVIAELPSDKNIHVILGNYSTHKRNDDWLAKYRGRVHFTSPRRRPAGSIGWKFGLAD